MILPRPRSRPRPLSRSRRTKYPNPLLEPGCQMITFVLVLKITRPDKPQKATRRVELPWIPRYGDTLRVAGKAYQVDHLEFSDGEESINIYLENDNRHYKEPLMKVDRFCEKLHNEGWEVGDW